MPDAGSVIAGYRVLRVLGSGGMGSVYLAQDPELPRQDALKVLSSAHSNDPEFRARFLREAAVAAGLSHPNIVAIHRRGETARDNCGSRCSSSTAKTLTRHCERAP